MIRTKITKKANSQLFLILGKLSAILVVLFLVKTVYPQQVPMKARDSKNTVNVGDFEKFNLFDGSMSFNFPLASIGGRGPSNGISYNYESRWRIDNVVVGYSGSTPNVQQRLERDPYAMVGLFAQGGGYLSGTPTIISTEEVPYCSNETLLRVSSFSFKLNFTSVGGKSYTFVNEVTDGQPITQFPILLAGVPNNPCSQYGASAGSVFVATDGSGTKFISSPVIISNADIVPENIHPSGVIKTVNGMTYGIEAGLVTWVEDRNGNKTTITNDGYQIYPSQSRPSAVKDALNREIQITYDAQSQYVNYKGVGGVSRTIKIGTPPTQPNSYTQTYGYIFPWLSQNDPRRNYTVGCNNQNYIEMPDLRRYKLTYNCHGDVSKVELPTGGSVEYDYELVGGSYYASTSRRLTERRVYAAGAVLENKTKYIYSNYIPFDFYSSVQLPAATTTTVKLFDSSGNLKSVSKHYFDGCIPDGQNICYVSGGTYYESPSAYAIRIGTQNKVEVYAADGVTLLRRNETEYEYQRANWNPVVTETPYKNQRVNIVTNTLADSDQISKVVYGYDSTVDFNLQTDVYEYDYAYNAPGNFLRRSHTEYKKDAGYTNNSVNLRTLPIESWVSSDYDGNNIVSRIEYEYDNYTSEGGPNPKHAALVPRANITGHNSNYGASYTTRGNVTKVETFANALNQTGAVSVHTQYDIAGNVVKAIDAKGHASTISYNDNFGSADAQARTNSSGSISNLSGGQQTFAFATSATNVAGYTTYAQFDYYSGAGVDAEDIIGNISTTFYNDLLDRPTQTISANNRPDFRRQTTAVYNDAANQRKVTITSDSKEFDDNLIKSEAFYDGLGRTFETREYENTSDYVVGLTEYDSLGRAYKSSNPHRPYLNEQPNWTTTKFDDLGRVTEVKSPDNGKVRKTYNGNSVRIYDQANRSRAGVTDAIGRLTKVYEFEPDFQWETDYTFDVLGRLRKTSQIDQFQNQQNRYFMYDDLGRLLRAKQPEQNANSSLNLADPITGNSAWSVKYEYDNNGNVTSTTDSRNITISGTYDNLNRLTLRDYSDSTPDVSFAFDNQNIPNSKGQLTAVTSSVSANYYTAFDELGRIKSSSQVTGSQTYNFPNYIYDLSGALVKQTYPSGRIVRTESDNINRLSKVTSQIPNRAEKTYINNLSYTSFGAVSQSRLGNGRWESVQFDAKTMQVSQIGLGYSVGNTSQLKIEYNYGTTTATESDNNGSLRQQKISYAGRSSPIIQNYTYDTLNRLESATETVNNAQVWKQTFSYDRFGNRRFDENNTTTLPNNTATYNPNINRSNNKFLVSEGYNYDAEGNLTSNPESQLFQYDANNRQTQVTNSAQQSSADYFYDGSGKRVRKIINQQEETIFVYDAFGKMVAEYANVIDTSRPKAVSYLTTDALGSPRIITDGGGNVISRQDFMPFGEEVAANVGGRLTTQGYAGNDGVRQQFTGYERDVESGLDYAQNRYFASKHGRFTSVDPLTASANMRNPQTFNRYSYALNSPYKFTDPLGLSPCGVGSSQTGVGRICNQEESVESSGGGCDPKTNPKCAQGGPLDGQILKPADGSIPAVIASTTSLTIAETFGVETITTTFAEISTTISTRVLQALPILGTPGIILGAPISVGNPSECVVGGRNICNGPIEETTTGATTGTTTAPPPPPSTIPLWRGIPVGHPGYVDATQGIARPRGGNATPTRHNLGDTNSIYTSWTSNPFYAQDRAGSGGIVLFKNIPLSQTVLSPNLYDDVEPEFEVLVKGTVTGAVVIRVP